VDTTWREHWVAALDALELEVEAAEAMLVDDHRAREVPVSDPWRPPAGLGPLPLDLRPRADGILARQLAAAEAIAIAITGTRRQVALSDRLETGGRAAARPAYVDRAM
jgi:hypothetical protein